MTYSELQSRTTYDDSKNKASLYPQPGNITAGTIKNNFKVTTESFVASDNAFPFKSSVKGTPAYWKVLYDVLAMAKQLGIPTYFLTLSCAY